MAIDLDQSGNVSQQVKVYLGPSLGYVMQQVKPERVFGSSVGNPFQLLPGDSIILSAVADGPVTYLLPDVNSWIKEAAYQPMTGFERAIWIKDFGGASANNITIFPFPGQRIDLQSSFTVINDFALIRLYPLFDLTGWFRG